MVTMNARCLVSMATVCWLGVLVGGYSVKISYENDLTCYTCPHKKDNRRCNRWAPDVVCPLEHTVCKTIHRFHRHTGESIRVDKSCALPEHCSLDVVGCVDTEHKDHVECVSCCSVSYCNVQVPYNLTTSLGQSKSVFTSAAGTSMMVSAVASFVLSLIASAFLV